MERVMTLDEEDIIRLIAKSVGVEVDAVRIKIAADISLNDDEEEPGKLGWIDGGFRFYAKVDLPVTQIDGTEVDNDLIEGDGEVEDEED